MVAVGIVGGIETGQVELVAISIIFADDITSAIENATNKAFDIYNSALNAISEFIYNGVALDIVGNFLIIHTKFIAPRNLKTIVTLQKNAKLCSKTIFKF